MDKKFYAHTRPINENGVNVQNISFSPITSTVSARSAGSLPKHSVHKLKVTRPVFTMMTAKQLPHFSIVFWIMVQRSIMQPPVHETSCCQTICS